MRSSTLLFVAFGLLCLSNTAFARCSSNCTTNGFSGGRCADDNSRCVCHGGWFGQEYGTECSVYGPNEWGIIWPIFLAACGIAYGVACFLSALQLIRLFINTGFKWTVQKYTHFFLFISTLSRLFWICIDYDGVMGRVPEGVIIFLSGQSYAGVLSAYLLVFFFLWEVAYRARSAGVASLKQLKTVYIGLIVFVYFVQFFRDIALTAIWNVDDVLLAYWIIFGLFQLLIAMAGLKISVDLTKRLRDVSTSKKGLAKIRSLVIGTSILVFFTISFGVAYTFFFQWKPFEYLISQWVGRFCEVSMVLLMLRTNDNVPKKGKLVNNDVVEEFSNPVHGQVQFSTRSESDADKVPPRNSL